MTFCQPMHITPDTLCVIVLFSFLICKLLMTTAYFLFLSDSNLLFTDAFNRFSVYKVKILPWEKSFLLWSSPTTK